MTLKIHELPADPGAQQQRHRVGRGESSGWGRTSGKGNKGQRARSGGVKGAAFEGGQTPLVRRVPKFGFTNVSFRAPRAEITLGQLDRFSADAIVDREALRQAGLVRKMDARIKVIATGTLSKKLTVKASGFSAGARAAIEAQGGVCEVVA